MTNGPSLAVPLLASQVAAAGRLRARLPQWVVTDAALEALGIKFPGIELEATLLKVAALNQLYRTTVYAVTRMARHVMEVMAAGPLDDGIVERLAALPKGTTQATDRRHLSFASKFAHFFIDVERFPIYDSYAAKMVKHHFGRVLKKWGPSVKAPPYADFVASIGRLRRTAGLACSARELDRYLWLSGLYHAWKKNGKAKIGVEAKKLFESSAQSPEIFADVTAMVPQ